MLLQLLGRRDFLDHDATGGDVPSIRVSAALVSVATVSNHQSDTNSSFANPLTVSSNLTVLVNVRVSVLPWFLWIISTASMVTGLEHSTLLKVKYQRLQQCTQQQILKSPSNSTFNAVLLSFFTKTQSFQGKR